MWNFIFFLFDNLGILITNYNLQLESSLDTFDPQTVLSDANNRLALQAALTSMLQQDSITVGSVVEIYSTTSRSQMSDSFNLNVTWNKTCSMATCSHQYHSHIINLLSNSNKTTTFVRYQSSNSTQIDWVIYQLPETIDSSKISSIIFKFNRDGFLLDIVTVNIDSKTIASLLNTLMSIDQTQNQPTIEDSNSTITG